MLPSKLLIPGLALAFTCGAFAQGTIGSSFCAALPNSTGVAANLTGSFGSGVGSDLHLEVNGGVPNEIGFFLVGTEATAPMSISTGLFCLAGNGTAQFFRYVIAGTDSISVGRFDSAGVLQNLVGTSTVGSGFDVPSTVPDTVPLPIMAGDTWHFQVWYRDTAVLSSNSNFSNGLSATFGGLQPIAGMVPIQAGTFFMGSDVASGVPYFGENTTRPVHETTLTQDFWMGEHEVTQAEYQALMGSNPSGFVGTDLPVEQVSWDDAVAYCAALTLQESGLGNLPGGYEYRLPTEAEWEFASRSGTTTEFYTGADMLCADANFDFSYHSVSSCALATTVSVGSYAPNAWGLFDMSGNVWEWCLDSAYDYTALATTDPFNTGGTNRLIRGGSWIDRSNYLRSAVRIDINSVDSFNTVGFRVVLGSVLVP